MRRGEGRARAAETQLPRNSFNGAASVSGAASKSPAPSWGRSGARCRIPVLVLGSRHEDGLADVPQTLALAHGRYADEHDAPNLLRAADGELRGEQRAGLIAQHVDLPKAHGVQEIPDRGGGVGR